MRENQFNAPWTVDANYDIYDKNNDLVAEVFGDESEHFEEVGKKRAALIAAAPKMFEMLCFLWDSSVINKNKNIRNKIGKILDKAEGENNE